MTEIATEDFTRYDPAVDREIRTNGLWTDHLILRLGHECNSPIYALVGFAEALAQGRPKTWRPRISWTFRFLTGRETDRLIVKPKYEWQEPDEHLPEGWWMNQGFRLVLIRWHAGPVIVGGHEFPKGVHVRSHGSIAFGSYRVRFPHLPLEFEREDLLAVAEVIETLSTDPAAVLARARGRCCFCSKPLTDPISMRVGYGPDCAQRLQLAHSARGGLLPR
jgi:hypothetical protein